MELYTGLLVLSYSRLGVLYPRRKERWARTHELTPSDAPKIIAAMPLPNLWNEL